MALVAVSARAMSRLSRRKPTATTATRMRFPLAVGGKRLHKSRWATVRRRAVLFVCVCCVFCVFFVRVVWTRIGLSRERRGCKKGEGGAGREGRDTTSSAGGETGKTDGTNRCDEAAAGKQRTKKESTNAHTHRDRPGCTIGRAREIAFFFLSILPCRCVVTHSLSTMGAGSDPGSIAAGSSRNPS